MSMVCPDCRETFEQALLCPKCGVRLLYQPSSQTDDGEGHTSWQHTPWGRVAGGASRGHAVGGVHVANPRKARCSCPNASTSPEPFSPASASPW